MQWIRSQQGSETIERGTQGETGREAGIMDDKPFHRVKEMLRGILKAQKRSKTESKADTQAGPSLNPGRYVPRPYNKVSKASSTPADSSSIRTKPIPTSPDQAKPILTSSDEASKTPSLIEALPLELKLHILSTIPALQSLRNLLRASPSFYRAIHGSSRRILKALLLQELSPSLLLEANSVCRAQRVSRDGTWFIALHRWRRDYKDAKEVLEREGQNWGADSVIEDDDVVPIAKLHLHVQELTERFCRDVLRPVSGPQTRRKVLGGKEWKGEISSMERQRIQRAMYRVETFVAWFGDREYRPSYRPHHFGGQGMADIFLTAMKPWEVEEVACVRDWMYRVYGKMLEETKELIWEFDLENEREELRNFMKEGKELEARAARQVLERREYWEREQCETLLTLGLPFLARMLNASSAEEKFDLLEEHLIPTILDAPKFLTEALEADPEILHNNHGHPHGHRRRRVEFDGDVEGGPNAAWVWSKRGRDTAAQERWFEKEGERWREWGWCLWDEGRLKGWGFGDWNWKNGERKEKGRWVCEETVRKSGRVLPKWVWVLDGEE